MSKSNLFLDSSIKKINQYVHRSTIVVAIIASLFFLGGSYLFLMVSIIITTDILLFLIYSISIFVFYWLSVFVRGKKHNHFFAGMMNIIIGTSNLVFLPFFFGSWRVLLQYFLSLPVIFSGFFFFMIERNIKQIKAESGNNSIKFVKSAKILGIISICIMLGLLSAASIQILVYLTGGIQNDPISVIIQSIVSGIPTIFIVGIASFIVFYRETQ